LLGIFNDFFSIIAQCLIELSYSILNRACISVDNYDQFSLGLPTTVLAYFPNKRPPHPIFSAPFARWREFNPYRSHPALHKISVDKHSVMGIFYDDNY
jgi:hypothetical protein